MVKRKYRQELLIDLLKMYSISGQEGEVAELVKEDLKTSGFKIKEDRLGNVYAVRGKSTKYPLLNAHMDIVELWYESKLNYNSYEYYYEDGFYDIYADEKMIDSYGSTKSCTNCYYQEYCDIIDGDNFICTAYKPSLDADESNDDGNNYVIEVEGDVISGYGENRVLGGDDKCGIFVALEVARNTRMPMKILFTVQEEVGLVGMEYFARTNEEWFDDVAFSITIDRKYGNQILLSQSGTKSCSKDFAKMSYLAGKRAGVNCEFDDGSLADVVILRDLVDNAINISAGYYDPHSVHEYIMYNEVESIIEWVSLMVKTNQTFKRRRYYDAKDLQKELGIIPLVNTKGRLKGTSK